MAKFIPWLEKIHLSKKRLTAAIVLSALSLNLVFTFSIIYLQKRSFSGQSIFDQAGTALGLLSRDTAEGNYRRVMEQFFAADSPLQGKIQSITFYDQASRETIASKGKSSPILCKKNASYFELHGGRTLVCHRSNSRLTIQMIFKSDPVEFLKTTSFLILILCNILFAVVLVFMTSVGMNLYLDRFVDLLKRLLNKDMEEKNIPQEFKSSFRVIEELMESLEQLKERVSKSAHDSAFNKASKKFIHNIRTPLNIIGTILFNHHRLEKEETQIVSNAVEEINISVGKILHGHQRKLYPVNLYSIIETAIEETRIKYGYHYCNFTLESCYFSKSYKKTVENIDFKSAVVNILNNAVEAMERNKGRVDIEMKKSGEGVSITITDEGCGIDEKILPRVGTEWFSHGKKDGNGLGLYTAKKDIESWGGSLTIRNRQDEKKGVVVEITI